MPPLPSDAEPRPPEDFAPLLATKEPVLLVGGQAVNLWAMYYETRTAALAPFVSRDVDVLGDRETLEALGILAGTDPQFYEGLVLGLQQLGVSRFHFIDSTSYADWNIRGLLDINDRLGVVTEDPERRMKHLREGWKTNWSKVPDGVIFKRIPHYAPVNEPDTWLLNVAKWKAHSMGLTQTVKNEQGLVAHPYTNFCTGWGAVLGVADLLKPDINARA